MEKQESNVLNTNMKPVDDLTHADIREKLKLDFHLILQSHYWASTQKEKNPFIIRTLVLDCLLQLNLQSPKCGNRLNAYQPKNGLTSYSICIPWNTKQPLKKMETLHLLY